LAYPYRLDIEMNSNNYKSSHQDWIRATATRNFAIDDPLLDWLNLYGERKGFRKDKDYDDVVSL